MKKLYDETSIQNIANAIRAKTGNSNQMTVSQMADQIAAIQSGNYFSSLYDGITIPSDWLSTSMTTVYKSPSSHGSRDDGVIYYEFIIRILEDNVEVSFPFVIKDTYTYLQSCVDWGDGSAVETLCDYVHQTDYISNHNHVYSAAGDYRVKFSHSNTGKHYYVGIRRSDMRTNYIVLADVNSLLYKTYGSDDNLSTQFIRIVPLVKVINGANMMNLLTSATDANGYFTSYRIYTSQSPIIYIIVNLDSVPSIYGSFGAYGLNIFYVEDNKLSAFRSATNWSAISERILPLSECPFISH